MVGRGVRDRTASTAQAESSAPAALATAPAETPPAPVSEPPTTGGSGPVQPAVRETAQQAAASPPPNQAPPQPADEEEYYNDLVKGKKNTSLAAAKGHGAASKTPDRPAAKPATSPAAAPPAPPPAVAEHGSSSSGYAVQLAAVRERSEADAIAKRLVSKGYQAYVLVPQPGKPPVYRVQVGRFKNRGEADKVAARLRKNEQFKPWVTH
jgi:DedD protein